MKESRDDEKFEQLIQKFDPQSRLLSRWELKGGVSARVTALEIESPDGVARKMVVRQHGAVDLKQNPQVAADEFRLLEILQSTGVSAPAPYYLDQSGDIFSTPYLVIEYIEGKPEFAPSNLADYLAQLATQLSRIHDVDCSKQDLSFLPKQATLYAEKFRERPARVDDSIDEGRIREVLESVWPLPQLNQSALIHGDYWPGNVLWNADRIAAVIDWEDAHFGDPLADLAISRLEILWAFGIDAMHNFTHYYQAMNELNYTNLPYWDLCAALRPAFKIAEWAAAPSIERAMRAGHRLFITEAFEKLAPQRAK